VGVFRTYGPEAFQWTPDEIAFLQRQKSQPLVFNMLRGGVGQYNGLRIISGSAPTCRLKHTSPLDTARPRNYIARSS
jgi:hypothetical protein